MLNTETKSTITNSLRCVFSTERKNKFNIFLLNCLQMSSSNPWGQWMGVKHGDEIEFVFGHPLCNTDHNYTEAERDLSLKMMKYFTDFAKTG